MEEKSRAQELSVREISLIRELAQIRKEHKRELEYEKFDGYELPPRTQFSMLNKPAVSIKYGVLLYWMSSNGKQALLQYRFRNVKNLKIYLCQIYRDSLKTYNNRAMRLLREECRLEFWACYEPASDNSGGKPENECWERCYPYSWKSGLYLRFAEERSEGYCNHAVCCGASHVL